MQHKIQPKKFPNMQYTLPEWMARMGSFHKIDPKMTDVYMLANQMLPDNQCLKEDSEKHALKEHYKYPVIPCDLPIESPGPREQITNDINWAA